MTGLEALGLCLLFWQGKVLWEFADRRLRDRSEVRYVDEPLGWTLEDEAAYQQDMIGVAVREAQGTVQAIEAKVAVAAEVGEPWRVYGWRMDGPAPDVSQREFRRLQWEFEKAKGKFRHERVLQRAADGEPVLVDHGSGFYSVGRASPLADDFKASGES